jgi:hypothetical protein
MKIVGASCKTGSTRYHERRLLGDSEKHFWYENQKAQRAIALAHSGN